MYKCQQFCTYHLQLYIKYFKKVISLANSFAFTDINYQLNQITYLWIFYISLFKLSTRIHWRRRSIFLKIYFDKKLDVVPTRTFNETSLNLENPFDQWNDWSNLFEEWFCCCFLSLFIPFVIHRRSQPRMLAFVWSLIKEKVEESLYNDP